MQKTIQISEQASIPDHVLQLAERHQFGQVRACYRRRLHRFSLFFLSAFIGVTFIVLIYGGYQLFLDFTIPVDQSVDSYIPIAIKFWIELAQMIIYIAAFVLAMVGVNPFWGRKKRLYVMEHGLLYINGKKSEAIRWDEVQAVFWWKKRGISYLTRKDGGRFSVIEEMDKPREVSEIVASAVTECLLPEMLAQYQEKGSVRFGPVSVTCAGIANWSKLASWDPVPGIAWDEIEDVHFERGKFGIKTAKKWIYWSAGVLESYKIPNPTVCVALIRQILQQREQEKA